VRGLGAGITPGAPGPTVIDPTTRPVVPKKDDPRFR